MNCLSFKNIVFLGLIVAAISHFTLVDADVGPDTVGFISGNLWFSKSEFYDNDKVKIYSAVSNGSDSDFKGTVEFYSNGAAIGAADFSVVGGGTQVVWTLWQARKGNYKISAKITKAVLVSADGVEKAVSPQSGTAGEIVKSVEYKPEIVDQTKTQSAKSVLQPLQTLVSTIVDLPSAVLSNVSAGSSTASLPLSFLDQSGKMLSAGFSAFNDFLDQEKAVFQTQKDQMPAVYNNKKTTVSNNEKAKTSFANDGVANKNTGDGDNHNYLQAAAAILSSGIVFLLTYKFLVYIIILYILYRFIKICWRFCFKKT